MSSAPTTDASLRADVAQASLDRFFLAPGAQLYNNTFPNHPGDNANFNYWWLAHVMDVRLDAFTRTGDGQWLDAAIAVHQNIVERNGGSLFNDYFDDMLWYGLATLRLHTATGDARYLQDARALWEHVVEFGWNDHLGSSLAWRKQQLYYKNTPANGPLVILSARLAAADDRRPLDYAHVAFDWLTTHLVDETTGFVQDGINREQDGRVDTQWRFTYNQGLYVGAAVELYRHTNDPAYLDRARRTALHAIDVLAADGVFKEESGGGDEGLFKGVFYRYLALLLENLDPVHSDTKQLADFIAVSTDELWKNSQREEFLLAGNDWSRPASGKVSYSTQLSAIMALEARARLAG